MLKPSYLLLVIASLLLSACGGSSTTEPETTPPPTTTPPPAPAPTNTETTGVITGFGSVFINGVEYETDSTEVTTDDNTAASEADLQVGMIVSLTGSVNDDGTTGTASAIHYEEQIKGPLDSIDLAANTLTVLGQVVVFDDLTNLENIILADLIPGDFLEISGFFNSNNELYATRIEKDNPVDETLKIEGVISQLDIANQTFALSNITIDYSNAEFVNTSADTLANDLIVRVKGDASALVNNVFSVNQVKAKTRENTASEGEAMHLEGLITRLDSTESFVVNGFNIIVDSNTEFEYGNATMLAVNTYVKVKGTINSEGNLVAKEIRIQQAMEIKIEGFVQAVDFDANTITVLDVVFNIDEQTQMKDDSDSDKKYFSLSDVAVNDFVEIKGFVDSNGDNIATQLERKNHDARADTEIKGKVAEIKADSFNFVISGITVSVTETTVLENSNDQLFDQASFFQQLQVDMFLEVKGQLTDGVFVATKVKIDLRDDDEEHQNRTEFRGLIESFSDTGFSVSGRNVVFNENTEYEVNDSYVTQAEFVAQIQVGVQVKVKGTVDTQGIITATSIDLEHNYQSEMDNSVEVDASGSLVDGILTVAGHTVTFTEQTQFKSFAGNMSRTAFLELAQQWQYFKVEGTFDGETIQALKIKRSEMDEQDQQIEISAPVEQNIEGVITVVGHTLAFDDNTRFYMNDEMITASDFLLEATTGRNIDLEGVVVFETLATGEVTEYILVNKIELKM